MQEQAAATLSDLAYGDMDMQDAIIAAGGVPPLITILRTGSKLSQEHAARAIWHLCAATDNQGVIVDGGVVTELVTLSRVGSAQAQELSAAVISDLAKGAIIERQKRLGTQERDNAAVGEPAKEVNVGDALDEAVAGDEQNGGEGAGDDDEGQPAAADEQLVEGGDRLSAIAAAGGVIPLVGLVTNGNQMGKERAASALLHLSVDAVNQVLIAKAGGIPPIVQLLDDGTEQAHEYAVAALARLAINNPENQTQIAKKLVSLLSAQSEGAQRRSAHVLWQLAETNTGAPNRIVNAGAISPLVALLGTGSIEAKEEAVGALTCLAHNNPSNQLAIARGLVGLLGAGTAQAQEQVTQMLIKFAQHPDNRLAIAESGAIQRLVIQLRGMDDTSLKAQELAATALSHLAGDSQANAASVAEHGGIKPLVAMLICESAGAQARAACALSFVTGSSREVQEAVANEGAIEYLTNLLRSPEKQDSEITSLEARFESAGALWSLSKNNEETTSTIAAGGAIGFLVELLHENDVDAQTNASGALASLAAVGSREVQDSIARASGIAPLVQLLDPKHKEVHVHASRALSELARDYPANQTQVAEAGGIKLLVKLLHGHGAEAAKAAAASALWSLTASHSENQNHVVSSDGLRPLCSLIGLGNAETQFEAAGALAAIALDNPLNQKKVAMMLVELLQSTDQETCTKAALAVSRLARSHPSNQVAIAEVGGITPLTAMVSVGLKSSRMPAIRGSREQMATAAVAGLASDDAPSPGLVRETADRERPERPSANAMLAAQNAALTQVALQKEAASALWSMANENTDNQQTIATEHGVPSLIALLSNSRSEVHRDAAGALWSLAAHPDNQQLIAECRGIGPLVKLLSDGDRGAQETAAGALHALAQRYDNRIAIAAAGGVPALTALLECGSEEAKAQAAGALSTMVVDNQKNQFSVAQSLVALLHNESSSSGAQEHATQLVHKLALDPENRGALSKWGAIPELARQLQGGSLSSQVNAASALSQIACHGDCRVTVTAQMIILLGSPTPEVRQRAFNALQAMAAEGGSDSRMTVKMAGGIERFVSLLKDGSLEAQEYALWLLWQSTDNASKRSIAMARCALPIVAILVSDNLSGVAKEHAASVLSGMTAQSVDEPTCAVNKQDIVDGGGVLPLVNLLKSGSMGAKRHASRTLAQLCRGADGAIRETQLAIMEAGASTALVPWLNDAALGPPAMAAHALAELSMENEATQNVIVQAGAIKPLVAMMVHGECDEQKWAASAVAALSNANSAAQKVIAEEGGIPPLVELLKRETVGPHEHATRAIWHLSSTRVNKMAIAGEGCLAPLVANLSTDESRAKWAAAALEALSSDCTENQLALARQNGIPPLANLLGSESDKSQNWAQGALLNIAVAQENRTAVVKPLVELLDVRNAAAQMKSAESLATLASRSAENRAVVAAAGAIPPLVRLLGDGRNVSTSQVRAAAALGDLARAGESKQAIVRAGGVEPLVAMLLSHNVEAQTRASIAVWQLAASTAAQQLIADAGGIQHLVKLLSCGNAIAATHAAGALWHLESLASTKSVIISAGGIAALVDLLGQAAEWEGSDGQDAIAALLSDLARERGNAKASIVQRGGVKHLVGLLENGSVIARKHASCAIWGLTSEPQYQKAVIKAGVMKPLINYLLSADQKAQGYAAAALNNLARDPEARQMLAEGGVEGPLRVICEGPETWLRSQAVGILKQLRIEAPAPRSMAQEMALRVAALAAQRPAAADIEERERSKSPGRRGWDSAYGNPNLTSETGEFDHLIMSPRNEKLSDNTYQRVSRPRRRIDEEAARNRQAPPDFDQPHPRVLAALAATKRGRTVRNDVDDSAQVPEEPKVEAAMAPATADELDDVAVVAVDSARSSEVEEISAPKGKGKRRGRRNAPKGARSKEGSLK